MNGLVDAALDQFRQEIPPMLKPATPVVFQIEQQRHKPDNTPIGDVVKSTHADVWRSHIDPAIGQRLAWAVNGEVRRWRIVGVTYAQHCDTWVLAVSEAVLVPEGAA